MQHPLWLLTALAMTSVGRTTHRSRWGCCGGGYSQFKAVNRTCMVAVVFSAVLQIYCSLQKCKSSHLGELHIQHMYVYIFISKKMRMCCICSSLLLGIRCKWFLLPFLSQCVGAHIKFTPEGIQKYMYEHHGSYIST